MKILKRRGRNEYRGFVGVPEDKLLIGGRDKSTKGKFVPNINMSKWNDEVWLNINHPDKVNGEKVKKQNEIISLSVGNNTHRFYPTTDYHFEYAIELKKYPDSNVLEFDLKFPEGLIFLRQRTYQENWDLHMADGRADFLGCKTFEEYKRIDHRPENVQGSYAVYWNKMHGKYKNGKFCHIFRPKLIDAEGTERWAELFIDTEGIDDNRPKMLISCNFKGLVFPVTVDPEIGYHPGGVPNSNVALTSDMKMCKRLSGLNRAITASSITGGTPAIDDICEWGSSWQYSGKVINVSGNELTIQQHQGGAGLIGLDDTVQEEGGGGWTTVGVHISSTGGFNDFAQVGMIGQSATIGLYCSSSDGGDFVAGGYAEGGTPLQPQARLSTSSSEVSPTSTPGWWTTTVTWNRIFPFTNYWFGFWLNATITAYYDDDNDNDRQAGYYNLQSYQSTVPNPFALGAGNNLYYRFGLYLSTTEAEKTTITETWEGSGLDNDIWFEFDDQSYLNHNSAVPGNRPPGMSTTNCMQAQFNAANGDDCYIETYFHATKASCYSSIYFYLQSHSVQDGEQMSILTLRALDLNYPTSVLRAAGIRLFGSGGLLHFRSCWTDEGFSVVGNNICTCETGYWYRLEFFNLMNDVYWDNSEFRIFKYDPLIQNEQCVGKETRTGAQSGACPRHPFGIHIGFSHSDLTSGSCLGYFNDFKWRDNTGYPAQWSISGVTRLSFNATEYAEADTYLETTMTDITPGAGGTIELTNAGSMTLNNFNIQIGDERIRISSRSANILTISSRGYDGSSAAAHIIGDVVTEVPFWKGYSGGGGLVPSIDYIRRGSGSVEYVYNANASADNLSMTVDWIDELITGYYILALRTWFRAIRYGSSDNRHIRSLVYINGSTYTYKPQFALKNTSDYFCTQWHLNPEDLQPFEVADVASLGLLPSTSITSTYDDYDPGGVIYEYWVELIVSDSPTDAFLTHHVRFGGVTDGKIKVWCKTDKAATIKIRYTGQSYAAVVANTNPGVIGVNSPDTYTLTTAGILTSSVDNFTCITEITGLSPDTKYYFDILVNDASVYAFEDGSMAYSRLNSEVSCYTFPIVTTFSSKKVLAAGDEHGHTLDWEMWENAAALSVDIRLYIRIGDETVVHTDDLLPDVQQPDSSLGYSPRSLWYERDQRHSWHLHNKPFWEAIESRKPVETLWSDHDYNEDNSSKDGWTDKIAAVDGGIQRWQHWQGDEMGQRITLKRTDSEVIPGTSTPFGIAGKQSTIHFDLVDQRLVTVSAWVDSGRPSPGDACQWGTGWAETGTITNYYDNQILITLDNSDYEISTTETIRETGGAGWSTSGTHTEVLTLTGRLPNMFHDGFILQVSGSQKGNDGYYMGYQVLQQQGPYKLVMRLLDIGGSPAFNSAQMQSETTEDPLDSGNRQGDLVGVRIDFYSYKTWNAKEAFKDYNPTYDFVLPDDLTGQATGGSTTRLSCSTSQEREVKVSGWVDSSRPSGKSISNGYYDDNPGDTCEWGSSWEYSGRVVYANSVDDVYVIQVDDISYPLNTGHIIRHSGGGSWQTTGSLTYVYNFPKESKYGIYPGMMVYHGSDATIESNVAFSWIDANSGNELLFSQPLRGPGNQTFVDSSYFLIKRWCLGREFWLGKTHWFMIDMRYKSDPQSFEIAGLPGHDWLDGTKGGVSSKTSGTATSYLQNRLIHSGRNFVADPVDGYGQARSCVIGDIVYNDDVFRFSTVNIDDSFAFSKNSGHLEDIMVVGDNVSWNGGTGYVVSTNKEIKQLESDTHDLELVIYRDTGVGDPFVGALITNLTGIRAGEYVIVGGAIRNESGVVDSFESTGGANDTVVIVESWEYTESSIIDKVYRDLFPSGCQNNYRIYESGGSQHGSTLANEKAGHVQREWVFGGVNSSSADWKFIVCETPAFGIQADTNGNQFNLLPTIDPQDCLRQYLIANVNYDNVFWFGADQHFCGLDDGRGSHPPFACANFSPAFGKYGRGLLHCPSISDWHIGFPTRTYSAWGIDYRTGNPWNKGAVGLVELLTSQSIKVSLYGPDGTIINNDVQIGAPLTVNSYTSVPVDGDPETSITVSPNPSWSTNTHQARLVVFSTGNLSGKQYPVYSNGTDILRFEATVDFSSLVGGETFTIRARPYTYESAPDYAGPLTMTLDDQTFFLLDETFEGSVFGGYDNEWLEVES